VIILESILLCVCEAIVTLVHDLNEFSPPANSNSTALKIHGRLLWLCQATNTSFLLSFNKDRRVRETLRSIIAQPLLDIPSVSFSTELRLLAILNTSLSVIQDGNVLVRRM